jgi:hypothetical protein
MKTLNTLLASVLTYGLVITPAFSQSEESRTTESEAPSESEAPEESRTTEAQPEVAPDATEQPDAEENDLPKPEKAKKKRKKVVDEPGAPPRGTGKIVGGIVTTSVGAGLGILTLFFANIDCNDINKDDADSTDVDKQKERETNIKDCKNGQKDAKVAGGVLMAAGLGVGLPLLYFGIQDRKVYNEWKAGQPAQEESAYAPGRASLVFIPSGNTFSPGINVSYNF